MHKPVKDIIEKMPPEIAKEFLPNGTIFGASFFYTRQKANSSGAKKNGEMGALFRTSGTAQREASRKLGRAHFDRKKPRAGMVAHLRFGHTNSCPNGGDHGRQSVAIFGVIFDALKMSKGET